MPQRLSPLRRRPFVVVVIVIQRVLERLCHDHSPVSEGARNALEGIFVHARPSANCNANALPEDQLLRSIDRQPPPVNRESTVPTASRFDYSVDQLKFFDCKQNEMKQALICHEVQHEEERVVQAHWRLGTGGSALVFVVSIGCRWVGIFLTGSSISPSSIIVRRCIHITTSCSSGDSFAISDRNRGTE